MINKIFWVLYGLLACLSLIYLILPSPQFPQPLLNSPQSKEPGDIANLQIKRAYFTDFTRTEITNYYESNFQIPFATFIKPIKLNYPPEEAEWHISSHTRSSYLEEYVYPFRESIFVNGYQPSAEDDQIAFEGRPYLTKVTVKYKYSNMLIRVIIGLLTIISIAILINSWKSWLIRFVKQIKQ